MTYYIICNVVINFYCCEIFARLKNRTNVKEKEKKRKSESEKKGK